MGWYNYNYTGYVDCLQGINNGIEDGTLSDIEEATKSKFYEYDTDWESSRKSLLLKYYQTLLYNDNSMSTIL